LYLLFYGKTSYLYSPATKQNKYVGKRGVSGNKVIFPDFPYKNLANISL
jgi:hypothetical protein